MPDNETPKKKATVVTSSKTASSLTPEIQNQFDFIQKYANSPKYKERLAKMVNTERAIQGNADPQRFGNELMSGYQTNAPTGQVVQGITSQVNQNLDNLGKGKIQVGDFNLGKNVAGGYDSAYKDIRMQENLLKQNPTVPVHELSHGGLGGNAPYTQKFADVYLKNVFVPPTNSNFEGEVQKPTEVKARLDAVRYLGDKYGLFDAGKTNFTADDFKKLQKSKVVNEDFNFKQLMSQFPKGKEQESMIWLMNNIAKLKDQPPTDEVVV